MMEVETTRKSKQMLDRPRADPPLGPGNISSGVKKDLPCSSPGCPNFCNTRCGFCEMHCEKFHQGVHYKDKSLRADIPDGVRIFLNLEKGDKLQWEMDLDKDGDRVAKITKKKQHSINEITLEDIELVVSQTNVTFEEAKRELWATDGDIARAIINITSRK